jgi:hypothetical protein
MERINCPYCDVEISMDEVDADGGACPECGAMVTGSLLFSSGTDDDDDEDDLDE